MVMLRGKKPALAAILHASRITSLVARRRAGCLPVVNYHRVRPDGHLRTPYDDEVFGPTESVFAGQIAWLKRHFRMLSEAELLSHLRQGATPSEPCALVTFDDGYVDNYVCARPILQRAGVPAIFFIPSRAIEERELGWWDLIAYLVKASKVPTVELNDHAVDLTNRDRAIRGIQLLMKQRPESETRQLVQSLSEACGVPLPPQEQQGRELMTWDQVKSCPASSIAIGSHSHSHRVLSTLNRAGQHEEFCVSRDLIADRAGCMVRTVAYPVGGREHFTAETQELARLAGFSAGFSFEGPRCWNSWSAIHPFDIRRIAAPQTVATLAAAVSMPELFGPA